jgi:hypothetical protein
MSPKAEVNSERVATVIEDATNRLVATARQEQLFGRVPVSPPAAADGKSL